MAKTIVGLYDDRNTAELVRDRLMRSDLTRGKDDDAVHTAFHDDKPSKIRFFGGDDLADSLSNGGIPEDEAILYGEGVRRGGNLVVARVDDDHAPKAAALMNEHRPIDVERRSNYWRRQGWDGSGRQAKPMSDDEITADRDRYRRQTASEMAEKEEQIPIIEEELRVGKREVERGAVHVHAHVEERPVQEKVKLRDERVEVERRDVDRKLSPREAEKAFQDRDVEMRARGEEAVVEKEARQKGEIVVKKSAGERTETVRETVRRTDVEVDESAGRTSSGRGSDRGFESFDDDFRRHHASTYGERGRGYETFEPAYRHGHTLGSDTRTSSLEWSSVEPDARRSYDQRHGKGSFEQVKDAIRHAYDRTRARHGETRRTRG